MDFYSEVSSTEKTARTLGHISAFLIFSFIFHYILSKFNFINMEFQYFIGIIALIYISSIAIRRLIKYEIHQWVF